METYDIICIGAGPTGLATAIEAKRAGLCALVIDKACLCNSIFHYPVNMVFFTTPELLEIGDLPLVSAAEKPTRVESLKYYRRAAEHYALELRLYERVVRVDGRDGNFTVVTTTEKGTENRYAGKKIAVATGYYDLPNQLGVPGEDLPHVSHYYTEPFEYWNQDVVVIGGKNSAAEAALDLYRNGARVTLVHRKKELGTTIKYWVRPDIENRIKAGQVRALFETHVKQITREEVVVENGAGEKRLPARRVFALTGYHPDFTFIEGLGVRLDPETRKPALDPNTLESNEPGIHLAGVVIGGKHTGEIFIENGRFHGKQITREEVVVENGAGEKRLPARRVFALTGYHPDFTFIEGLGVRLDPETRKPALDPNTLESNVPGIHLAGVVIGGKHTGEIFIENGRFHGKQIIQALAASGARGIGSRG